MILKGVLNKVRREDVTQASIVVGRAGELFRIIHLIFT